MTCVTTVKACKASGEKRPYAFNWTLELSRRWEANTPFSAGVAVRPSSELLQTGFEYESSGGQSNGKKEPKWPTALGGTVTDGSITWTAVSLTNDSLLEQIATSAWQVPVGLSGSGESTIITPGQQAASIDLADGAAETTYTVVNEIVTTTGTKYVARLELTID
jgi:hypothetical protein